MEIIRVAQPSGEDKNYIRCETHNFYYSGRPPLVSGCSSCWLTYFMGQRAQMKPDVMDEALDQLDGAISAIVECVEQGTWDFSPLIHPEIKIEHEN